MNEVVEQLLKTEGVIAIMGTFPYGRFDNLGINLLIDDMNGQSLAQVVRDLFLPYGQTDTDKEAEILLQDLITHYEVSYSSIPALEVVCPDGEQQIIGEFFMLIGGISGLIEQFNREPLHDYKLVYIELSGIDTVTLLFKVKESSKMTVAAINSMGKSSLQSQIADYIRARKRK